MKHNFSLFLNQIGSILELAATSSYGAARTGVERGSFTRLQDVRIGIDVKTYSITLPRLHKIQRIATKTLKQSK